MNKTAVIYKSNYGSTTQYAEAIAKALSGDLIPRNQAANVDLSQYDTIIYGGGLYAGGIIGVEIIAEKFETIKDKSLIVFTVGVADPSDVSKYRGIINKAFTEKMQQKIKFFHLRGDIDYTQLSSSHRAMMWVMKNIIQNKSPDKRSDEDHQVLDTYGQVIKFLDLTTIQPIVDYVKVECPTL